MDDAAEKIEQKEESSDEYVYPMSIGVTRGLIRVIDEWAIREGYTDHKGQPNRSMAVRNAVMKVCSEEE